MAHDTLDPGARMAHWHMPRFDALPDESAAPAAADDQAAALDALRDAARAEGHAAGREAGYADGHREGLAAGHAAGLEAGRAAAADELDQQLDAWSRSVDSAVQGLRAATLGADDLLVDALGGLVAQIARAVLARELGTAPDALDGVIGLALDHLRECSGPVQVHGSPDVLAHLRELGVPDGLELRVDPALTDGCRIVQPGSVHDVLVSERFSRLVDEALAVRDVPPPQRPRQDAGDPG